MLCTPATPEEIEALVASDQFCVATKIDGYRAIWEPRAMRFLNREAQLLTKAVPPGVAEFCWRIPPMLLDGEITKDHYSVFDIQIPATTLRDRLAILERIQDLAVAYDAPVSVLHHEVEDKAGFITRARLAGAEGVVLSDLDGYYREGYTSSRRKVKFVADYDTVVMALGIDRKNNMALGVWRDGELVEVAHCSSLTGDGPLCRVGDPVSVRAHSLTAGGRLREPVKPRLRTGEISPATITWEKLVADSQPDRWP